MIAEWIQKHARLLVGLVCCTYLIDCSVRRGLSRIERKYQHATQAQIKKQQSLLEHIARLQGKQTLPTDTHERQQMIINTLLQAAHQQTITVHSIARKKSKNQTTGAKQQVCIECSGPFANLYTTLATLEKAHPDIQYERCTFTNNKGTIHHVLTTT